MLRRAWALLTASDPALGRLRMASTTLCVLTLTVIAVIAVATAWGQPVVPAILGVVVAMISCLAVNDPRPRDRAITTALMVPAAAVSATVAALDRSHQVLSDAVFVLVMVAAVYLRRWGPRGMAVGMIAFISYFMALFLQATPSQLPVMIVGAAIGATISFTVRHLLRPRHPDRDLRRELAAWSVRASRALDALDEPLAEGRWPGRTRQRLRGRVLACAETANAAESRLQDADDPLWDGMDNDELAVRVFDAQLALERVVALSVDVVGDDAATASGPAPAVPDRRTAVREALGELRARLGTAVASRRTAAERSDLDPVLAAALDRCAEAWQRAWSPRPDEEGLTHAVATIGPDASAEDDDQGPDDQQEQDGQDDSDEQEDSGGAPSWRDLSRTAAQVAVAAVIAIVVGELLSPTRWFWAVIAAFVVFTGASTREEILSKGWQRVVGTVFGVAAGVVVAALVGGNTVGSLAMIALCVFLGIYLVRISIAWMMFFITTMLGLLYGLLGQFSVNLLVLRLEETVAGAAAGAFAAYVVLPASGRHAATEGVAAVLDDLAELLDRVVQVVTEPAEQRHAVAALEQARTLRDGMDGLRATAKPLTGQVASLTHRTGLRHVVRVVDACEHHARALARGAADATGVASTDARREVVGAAVDAVCRTLAAVRPAFGSDDDPDRSGSAEDTGVATPHSADEELEALRRLCVDAEGRSRDLLWSMLRHLRAIDGALQGLAREVGGPSPQSRDGRGPGSGDRSGDGSGHGSEAGSGAGRQGTGAAAARAVASPQE